MKKQTTPGVTLEKVIGQDDGDDKKKSAIASLRQQHNREFDLCSNDLWYFTDFVRTDDEENKAIRTFPQFEYLIDANAEIDKHQKTIILKSRRMLVSWLGVLRQLHKAMFAGTGALGCEEIFRGGLMSIGQVEAEHLTERIYKVYNRLPEWMKERSRLITDNKLIAQFEHGGIIQAFPVKKEGARGFGFTEVLFDEMAFQEGARPTWMGMMPTLGAGGKVIAVSTPNGRKNLFADIWIDEKNKYTNIKHLKIHWTSNPEHDDKWLKMASEGMDEQGKAREFELSFIVLTGQAVWGEYNRITHVWDAEKSGGHPAVMEGNPMWIGWDLGYLAPAATFWQMNNLDQWIGFMEVQGRSVSFDRFAERVRDIAESFYDRTKVQEIHAVPPDARNNYRNRAATGANNDLSQIKLTFKRGGRDPQVRFSPGEVGTRDNEGPRLKLMRLLWRLRADGNPGIVFSDRMEKFIEGCEGGYCYSDKGDNEQPLKNDSSHPQDSAQHVVAAHSVMTKSSQIGSERKEETKRRRIGKGGL